MKVVFILIRLTGYLLGSFALFSGVADVLGFIPHSYETPPWPARLMASLPSMLAGAVLLVPIKYCLRGAMLYVLAAGYALVVLAAVVLSVQALIGYSSGTKGPAIVPAAMIFLYIPVANAFVLWRMRRDYKGPPNNSFKPNLSADAAKSA
ncbi:hypothetical protein IB223_16270 [Pseudoxanthomonas sp. PXM03]|uniref:hypothetical protein n=1 Tax=Pseudoxanthomonas sp. PXM03 TaxID=2769284 RepID=UPI00177D4C89|nr:hypothetical protein [Pseudoxanthomonas sp. PXM03]MBD9437653.1 hypothetical protein [Pseudoxanthomonas sp. PXM03]